MAYPPRDPILRTSHIARLAPLVLLLGGTPALLAQQATPPATPPAAPPASTTQDKPATPPAQAPAAAPGQAPAAKPGQPPAKPAAPAPPSGPPGAAPDRLDFELKFPKEKGGGSATGSAARLDYRREDYAVLTGGEKQVQMRYQDLDLKADNAELDLKTKVVTATGNVVLDQGPKRMTGDTLVFDLDSKTGKMTHASATVSPDYYFTGTVIEKTGDDTYEVTDGIFTSCNQPTPDWSFRLAHATVEVEGYAHIAHTSLRVKKVPVFYLPYMLWPVKRERASGFLVPSVGFSSVKGASLGLAYFQTLGRSWDTTFHLDSYTKGFLGVGNEVRYKPTAKTTGDAIGYLIRDPDAERWRWKLEWNHTSDDLPLGMRGVVNFLNYSDFGFFRDFERDFDRNSLRSIYSRANVSGNWGPHLLNFLVDQRETFNGLGNDFSNPLVLRKLPEVEYRLRQTRVWKTPFYVDFDGTTSYLDVDRPGAYKGTYGRVDLQPQITLPIKTFPWLSLSVTGGERLTWYGDSLDTTSHTFTGNSLSRALPVASASIVGPSFSRTWTGKLGDFGKFKHIIEPRWTYNYLGTFDEFQEVPLFDSVDGIGLTTTNFGRFTLANRVLAKPDTPEGVAREIVTVELSRSYSFDPAQPLQAAPGDPTTKDAFGPLDFLLRLSPTEKTSLRLDASYGTLFRHLNSTGLTASLAFGKGNNLGLTWFTSFNQITGQSTSDNARLNASIDVWPSRLRLEGYVTYDFEAHLLQQAQLVANYTSQCYGLRFEVRNFSAGAPGAQGGISRFGEKDYRLSVTLKNVGTILDLNSRKANESP